jgi:protein-L-isoaspartate(D-aspartate) O-methyltransferase
MVDRLKELGIRDPRVLAAMRRIERHRFVESGLASRAYEDTALPLLHGQTISQPYIVARCAELVISAMPDPKSARVLEIGTGCGYAAAVLSDLVGTVYSIERIRALHETARANLRPFRIANLRLAFGDGMLGLPSQSPFDAIVSTAASEAVPAAWLEQLAPNGLIVAPLGAEVQHLTVISKGAAGGPIRNRHELVRFVPLLSGTLGDER